MACSTIRLAILGVVALLAPAMLRAADPAGPKAYVIGEIDVTDPQGYRAYASATPPILAKYGGVYVARGGRTDALEGAPPAGRIAIIEFPNLAAAQAFEHSPEYRAIATIRQRTSTGRVFIVEGVAP